VFADRNALRHREAEHLYSIRFASREIWADKTQEGANVGIRVDLWEPHLDPV
jgi:hypothetical protein